MTDPVLTDEEKGALLEGMSNGELEVKSSSGRRYADVRPFEIAARSIISTRSYPRLQNLNREFAARLGKRVELLLNSEASVSFIATETSIYSDACEQNTGLSLIVEFSAKPLQGSALIRLGASAVGNLVETFFGGSVHEAALYQAEGFTPGEISVATLFGEAVLAVLAEVWAPIEKFTPEMVDKHLSSGVIDSVDPGDTVINSEFRLDIGAQQQVFHVLWPLDTVASLLPVLEGQKRERDAAEDARWARCLRAGVTNSVIRISSDVAQTRTTLGAIVDLSPGDVISIGNPRAGTVSASNVAIIRGRFGVHDGRYAMETVSWLTSESGSATACAG